MDNQVSTSQDLLRRLGAVPIAGEQECAAIPECKANGVARTWLTLVGHLHLECQVASKRNGTIRISDVRQVRLAGKVCLAWTG